MGRLHENYVIWLSFTNSPQFTHIHTAIFPVATASIPILTKTGSNSSLNFTWGADNSILDPRHQMTFQICLCGLLCCTARFQKWIIIRDVEYAFEEFDEPIVAGRNRFLSHPSRTGEVIIGSTIFWRETNVCIPALYRQRDT